MITQTLSSLQAQCEVREHQQLSDRLQAAKEQWDRDNPGREAEIVAALMQARTVEWKANDRRSRQRRPTTAEFEPFMGTTIARLTEKYRDKYPLLADWQVLERVRQEHDYLIERDDKAIPIWRDFNADPVPEREPTAAEVAEIKEALEGKYGELRSLADEAVETFIAEPLEGEAMTAELIKLFERGVSAEHLRSAFAEVFEHQERMKQQEIAVAKHARRAAVGGSSAYDEPEDEDAPLYTLAEPQGILLKYPDGGVGFILGQKNHLKTTVTVDRLIAAMTQDRELRVLYLAGEMPRHVRKLRDVYGLKARLTTDDLKARFHIRNELPALHLQPNADAILAEAKEYKPHMVVIDTWQRAVTGVDENSSRAAQMLTHSGLIGQLIRATKAMVYILAHPAAGDTDRIRGFSGVPGAADYITQFITTHHKGAFKATLVNMRGGAAGAEAHAKFAAVAKGASAADHADLGPPDLSWIDGADYRKALHDPRPKNEAIVSPRASEQPRQTSVAKKRERDRLRMQRKREKTEQ